MLYKKPISYDFDTIVIGSGAAGSIAAQTLARAGKKVGLVESGSYGGASLRHTSVPTTALYEAAQSLYDVQRAPHFGVLPGATTFRYASIKSRVEQAVSTVAPHEHLSYKHPNLTVIRGHAHFVSPHTVSVAVRRYHAKTFVIASGSEPYVPAIPGLDETPFMTYIDATALDKLPKSLAIVGGGASGYQYAHIFATFGVRVHLFESHGHLLPDEDNEVGDLAAASLAQRGVRVHTGAHATHIQGDTKRVVITFSQNGQHHRLSADQLLLASGSAPRVDLGLENTGIRYDEQGIRTNHFGQTNVKHIYAVGDCTSPSSTSGAIREAQVAAHNLLHRRKVSLETHALPRVALGMPQIACVGKTEHELKWNGAVYQTAIAPLAISVRRASDPFQSGFVKVVANQHGLLLGASIVAPHASDMLPELSLAVYKRMRACDVANTVHAFPTWTEAVRVACSKIQCI